MSDETVEINIKGLESLLKALKTKMPKIRVGILGDNAQRDNGGKPGMNNATIGAIHEYGKGEKGRSFLRIPLTDRLNETLQNSGVDNKDVLKQVIAQGSIIPWAEKIAICAEGIVLGAFDTGGYGAWKPSNMAYKKVQMTLVETQQLRNSITSEVKG